MPLVLAASMMGLSFHVLCLWRDACCGAGDIGNYGTAELACCPPACILIECCSMAAAPLLSN